MVQCNRFALLAGDAVNQCLKGFPDPPEDGIEQGNQGEEGDQHGDHVDCSFLPSLAPLGGRINDVHRLLIARHLDGPIVSGFSVSGWESWRSPEPQVQR